MAKFVGGEPISVDIDEPITFENKTDTAFDVGYGIVFRNSGLYRVSVAGRHVSIAVEPERKTGHWILKKVYEGEYGNEQFNYVCSECGVPAYEFSQPYCHR